MGGCNEKRKKLEVTLAFWIALAAVLTVVFCALAFSDRFESFTGGIREAVSRDFGWFYLLTVMSLVAVCFFLIFNPIGKIRLGDPGSRPKYSTPTWIAMLFSAGMGIGLVFYGAAEPLSHYAVQAPEEELYSREALSDAFKYSFFHYGIHAWAIYAIVALALAYFQFRKKESTLLSVTLKPLIGNAADGPIGKVVDSFTIFATVIGVATSLGSGALQINSGLNDLCGVPEKFSVQLIIIVVATILFMASATSGLDKGVKTLSNLNMVVAGALMVLLRVGGLNALQNVLIIIALPFAVLLVIVTIALVKELNYERQQMGLYLRPKRYPEKDSPFRSYEDDEDEEE